LAPTAPTRGIEIRAGKFSLVGFFETNAYGSDSDLQFLNWAVDNNAAYDHAANTRGYTDAAMTEYDDHRFSARFAVALMPKVANGIYWDADIGRARAENLEVDFAGNRIRHSPSVFRLLIYLNQADMGNYEASIREYLEHQTPTPDITATRSQGTRSGRRDDRAGAAVMANGIVAAHQEYLALGGLGLQLGDLALSYGLERTVEGFCTAHVWRGVFVSYNVQQRSVIRDITRCAGQCWFLRVGCTWISEPKAGPTRRPSWMLARESQGRPLRASTGTVPGEVSLCARENRRPHLGVRSGRSHNGRQRSRFALKVL
jgi:high affinity Mn2+ porin